MSHLHSLTSIANKHDFDTTFTAEFDQDRTAAALITPTTGKRIKVTGVYVSTEGTTTAGQRIRLYFATSANTVASFFPATSAANAVSTSPYIPVTVTGAVNEALSITSNLGGDKNYYISVNYKEE